MVQDTNNNTIKYFTQNEMQKLFQAIKNSTSKHSLRDFAIIRVCYRCGLRASEIALIKLNNYNKEKGELYCQRLKGSKNNTIRLDSSTKKALDEYIKIYNISNSNEILFKSQENKPISRQTLDYIMKKYCKEANIQDKSKHHFHTIKHTTAVHLAESGLDIKELQWWLGHKSVSNTEIYFQFTTKQQEMMYKKLNEKNEMV
ncbi:tyrosine-type recombinase/integrase [Sporanaerobacter acetigenes]|uniref:Phage integrase family protein n=1 Tax=Sporanaerobacter acetigenes DSM 13106 TaxID=1123281 RepID=A0A1M5Y334_9FIRM|nr:site-specific integrase [Sporanaerobacter acetigenes]SHI06447.1 Phage integrase family protein [Sporanaerobacter acetigenes DSM 13106]